MNVRNESLSTLERRIAELQEIQKTSPSTQCSKWRQASDLLQPLFAEMARRQKTDLTGK